MKGLLITMRKNKMGLSFILLYVVFVSLSGFNMFEEKPSLGYTEFVTVIGEKKVDHVVVMGGSDKLKVVFKDGTEYTTLKFADDGFLREIAVMGVEDIRTQASTLPTFLISMFTNALLIGFLYILMKVFAMQLRMVSEGKENSNEENVKLTVKFDDVAGMTEEKAELRSAIESLVNTEKLAEKGMRPIRGVLMEGPPGVGKTLLAKAIAGEAGVNFLSFSGAEFNHMYVGVGALRARAMFKKAKELSPCVVFIDEIDSVGAKRVNNTVGGGAESNNTLTSILTKMDGLDSRDGILFIGATNRLSALDSALTRPGRFDKIVHIGVPKTKEDREAVVEVHTRNKKFTEDATVEAISKLCYGMSGAEIEGALNEAVMVSVLDGCDGIINLNHIDKAVMKLRTGGVQKGSHSDRNMWRVAVHEMGHAIINNKVGRNVIKVSVEPYSSGIGGVTLIDGDSANISGLLSRQDILDSIEVLYAGMVAEELVLGNASNGCSADLEQATGLLHNMVANWGMGESLLSSTYFDKAQVHLLDGKEMLVQMESLGAKVRLNVREYLSKPEIKDFLIEMSKLLSEEEVLYDIGFPSV